MNTYCTSLPAGFETLETALTRKEKLASLLNEGGRAERRLARKLEQCGSESSCDSGACPICTRELRIGLLSEALPIIEAGGPRASSFKPGHTRYWTAASVIPAGYRCALGDLQAFELATKVKSMATVISRSSLASGIVIGGFDVSLNTTSDEAPCWQLHLYLLITGKPEETKKVVRSAFKPEPSADRPHRCTLVYSPRGALTYAYKAVFSRRSSYRWEARKFTRHLPLTPDQQRELALFLDQGDAGGRLILSGLRRNGSKLVRLR